MAGYLQVVGGVGWQAGGAVVVGVVGGGGAGHFGRTRHRQRLRFARVRASRWHLAGATTSKTVSNTIVCDHQVLLEGYEYMYCTLAGQTASKTVTLSDSQFTETEGINRGTGEKKKNPH